MLSLSPDCEHASAFRAGGETLEEAYAVVGDVEAFRSLSMAVTPRFAVPTPARTSTRKQSAQQQAMKYRLRFVNKVGTGPGIHEISFRLYFGKYIVVDVKRPLDTQTKAPHPTHS